MCFSAVAWSANGCCVRPYARLFLSNSLLLGFNNQQPTIKND